MELNEIFALWDRFDSSDAVELNYAEGNQVFRLSRSSSQAEPVKANSQPKHSAEAIPPKQKAKMTIDSPLVGTFYRAASPEEEPYVMIGQQVCEGDVIGIVESMKMMNEITADKAGIVVSIDAEDGQIVEFHQPLIGLEAAHV